MDVINTINELRIRFAMIHDSSIKHDSLLILNSDKSMIRGLTVALIDYFREIRTTTNPVEAASYLHSKKFTVIITGTEFVSDDGLDVISNLRQHNPFAKLLVVTGPLEKETRTKVELLNIQKIYEKPFSLNDLISDIKTNTKK